MYNPKTMGANSLMAEIFKSYYWFRRDKLMGHMIRNMTPGLRFGQWQSVSDKVDWYMKQGYSMNREQAHFMVLKRYYE